MNRSMFDEQFPSSLTGPSPANASATAIDVCRGAIKVSGCAVKLSVLRWGLAGWSGSWLDEGV
jgi:hypothetical protein